MLKNKIVSADEAVSVIKSNHTVAIGGAGAGHAVPDKILASLGKHFLKYRYPKYLRIIHPCGIGDNDRRGLNHIALEGLIDVSIGGFWGNAPGMVELAKTNRLRGYNLPQGVLSHLMRAAAAGDPGVITRTGLHTFVDPRLEGGKMNEITKEDIVEVVELNGKEYLFYKAIPIDIAIIRGTSVDREGNLTMEEEVGSFSMLSMAQAAKCNGGKVIAQVKRIQTDTYAVPGHVKVPGIFIDRIVVDPDQEMTFISPYDLSLVNRAIHVHSENLIKDLDEIKKIIVRRAVMELKKDAYINLGYGTADGIPLMASKEGILADLHFMIEQGGIGGVPTTGLNFGAMNNPSAIIDDGYQFDFFQGGGLDLAYLGFAQVDKDGNVNASRFGNIVTGCGGFIDISQNAKKVVFCGTFAVGAVCSLENGKLSIKYPGKIKKFINRVEQVTFCGNYAIKKGQRILYITERAVFEISEKGLILTEVAPGVNIDRDILALMEFKPFMPDKIHLMEASVFHDGPLDLPQFINHPNQ